MSAFSTSLARALRYEGGYSNRPNDRGGPTNKGITQRVYDAYRDRHKKPRQSVIAIEDAEVEAIYFQGYWIDGKCDVLTDLGYPGLAAIHFDSSVNHGHGGPGKAFGSAELLQRAAGVREDGVIGPITLAAIAQSPEADIVSRYADARMIYMARIVENDATQAEHIEGWLARVISLRNHFISPSLRDINGHKNSC